MTWKVSDETGPGSLRTLGPRNADPADVEVPVGGAELDPAGAEVSVPVPLDPAGAEVSSIIGGGRDGMGVGGTELELDFFTAGADDDERPVGGGPGGGGGCSMFAKTKRHISALSLIFCTS